MAEVILDARPATRPVLAACLRLETEQQALNAAAYRSPYPKLHIPACLLINVRRAYLRGELPVADVAAAQAELNREARRWIPLRPFVDAFDAALAHYHALGGDAARAPGIGELP